jgi:hypothetical protein
MTLSRRSTKHKPSGSQGNRPHRVRGAIHFPEVRGKILQDVHVITDHNFNGITLTFNDKTELTFDIEPGISVKALLESWKTGRVLKRWEKIQPPT